MNARPSFVGLGVLIIASVVTVDGQVVIGSAAPPPVAPMVSMASQSSSPLGALSGIASAFANQGPLLKWGPLSFSPRLSYSYRYGSGILRVPGEPENTTNQIFAAGIHAKLGERWNLDYTVNRSITSSRLLSDTTNHNANLSGGFVFGDWRLGIFQSYGTNSPTLVETGTQTSERTHATTGTILYDMGSRTQITLTATRSVRDANPVFSSTEWTGSDWVQWTGTLSFNYHFSQRLTGGIGMLAGYDEISENPDMTYSQPQIHLTWRAADKITLNATAGIQSRIVDATAARRQRNGVYSGSLAYSPLATTLLTLTANQDVSSSYFSDQTVKKTSWGLSLQQRIASRFFASAGIVAGESRYVDSKSLSTGRADKFRGYSFSVSTTVLRQGSLAVSYQRSKNSSNAGEFAFTSDVFGVDVSYSF